MHEDAGVAEVPQRQAERDVALFLVERDDAHLRAWRERRAVEATARSEAGRNAAVEQRDGEYTGVRSIGLPGSVRPVTAEDFLGSTPRRRHDLRVADTGLCDGLARRPRPRAGAAASSVSSRSAERGHAVEVVERVQEAGDAVLDHLRQPADARGDDRHLAGHRLERRQAEALLRRRQQEHVGDRQQRHAPDPARRGSATSVGDARARAPAASASARSGPSPTISRRAGTLAADAREDLDDRRRRA